MMLFSAATGGMVNRPSQDICIGCCYLTLRRPEAREEGLNSISPTGAVMHGRAECMPRITRSFPEGAITLSEMQRRWSAAPKVPK